MSPGGLIAMILAFVLATVSGVTPSAPAERSVPRLQIVDRMDDQGGAGQLVVVDVAAATDTWAQVQAFERVNGAWVPKFEPIEARIGRSGVAADRWEGDGTTPA